MANYYYLTSTFPRIEVGAPPELNLSELWTLFSENLQERDWEPVRLIRRYWDIQNLRLLWLNEELDPVGNYSEMELEEALLTESLPQYVCDFDSRYSEIEEKLAHFPALITQFFQEEVPEKEGFLKSYLSFEREWRLVMIGFRSKKLGRNLAHELRYEDASDDVVAQLMAQKDAKTYEPPYGYEDLRSLFESRQDQPLALHRAVSEYRFNKVRELYEGSLFSMDRVLGFLVQLIIVEKWEQLDKQHGQSLMDTIVKERT